jgi:hypothetical protein
MGAGAERVSCPGSSTCPRVLRVLCSFGSWFTYLAPPSSCRYGQGTRTFLKAEKEAQRKRSGLRARGPGGGGQNGGSAAAAGAAGGWSAAATGVAVAVVVVVGSADGRGGRDQRRETRADRWRAIGRLLPDSRGRGNAKQRASRCCQPAQPGNISQRRSV